MPAELKLQPFNASTRFTQNQRSIAFPSLDRQSKKLPSGQDHTILLSSEFTPSAKLQDDDFIDDQQEPMPARVPCHAEPLPFPCPPKYITKPQTDSIAINLPVIVVLGPPAGGKDKLCADLAKDFDFYHLSVGAFLRLVLEAYRLTGLPVRSLTSSICDLNKDIDSGKLLQGIELVAILEEKIQSLLAQEYKGILLDDFPRSLDQQTEFAKRFRDPVLVLSLSCEYWTGMIRYVSREDPGRPPPNVDVYETRFEEFEKHNPAILSEYEKRTSVVRVDTMEFYEDYYEKVKGKIIALGFNLATNR